MKVCLEIFWNIDFQFSSFRLCSSRHNLFSFTCIGNSIFFINCSSDSGSKASFVNIIAFSHYFSVTFTIFFLQFPRSFVFFQIFVVHCLNLLFLICLAGFFCVIDISRMVLKKTKLLFVYCFFCFMQALLRIHL